jgi:hypothetical protein
MVRCVGLYDGHRVPAELQEFLVEQFCETVHRDSDEPARRVFGCELAVASAARRVAYSSEAAKEASASRSRK